MLKARSSGELLYPRGNLRPDPAQGELLRPKGEVLLPKKSAVNDGEIRPDPRGELLWIRGEVIPVTWTFPLGENTLRVKIYPPKNRILPREVEVDGGCTCETKESLGPCSPLATLEWLDAQRQVIQTATAGSLLKLRSFFRTYLSQESPPQMLSQLEALSALQSGYGSSESSMEAEVEPISLSCPTSSAATVGCFSGGEGPAQGCLNAGTLGSDCCDLSLPPRPSARTIYVSAEAVDGGTGERPEDPAPISVVQELLSEVTTFTGGLTILFRRGDTWTMEDARDDFYWDTSLDYAGNKTADWRSVFQILAIRASGVETAPLFIGAYVDPAHPSGEDPLFLGNGNIRSGSFFGSASPCIDAGRFVPMKHYETGLAESLGPDFEYVTNLSGAAPDIGADEVGAVEIEGGGIALLSATSTLARTTQKTSQIQGEKTCSACSS